MKNDKGFALVAALVVMTLLLALAGAAMTSSSIGFMSISSDRKYQLATWAAEYAINEAIKYAVDRAACPPSTESGTIGTGINTVNWSYFAVPAAQYCFVHSRGFLGSTSVIKTMVVPKTAKFGGMITRGGTINITGGAAAVAGCDTADTASCGIMPGVITSANLSGNFGQTPAETCASNPIGGLVGSPPIVQDASIGDLFARYFNVANWDGLKTAISSKYKIPAPNPSPASPSVPSPSSPIPVTCTSEGLNDPSNSCCQTTSNTVISCYNNTGCTGTVVKTINLTQCRNGTDPDPLKNPIFVKIDSPLNIRHNISQGIITNPDLRNASSVSTMTISAALTASPSGDITKISTGGNVTVISSITNTNISSSGSVNINASATHSQIVSAQDVTIANNMTNSNVFANNIIFNIGNNTIAGGCGASSPNPCPDPSKAGGTFYANNNISIQGNGNKTFGTDADPLIMLAGNQISVTGAGNSTIRGLLATNGMGLNITGSYEIKGTIINNSASSQLSNSGNADIKFNMGILKEVWRQFGSLMQEPTCGGGNIYSTIKNTKMIAY